MKTTPAGLLQFLQQVPDPRGRKGRRHPLTAMLAVIVASTMCRFDGYESAADWIRLLPIEVWHTFGGTRKPPCANAFRKLMNKICPMQLQAALQAWITEGLGLNLEEKASAIVIDGKVLRGTRSDHAKTMQILAALDQYTGCVLSETQVAADTNEGKTALELLKGLILHGKTVVGDAAFCQREICDAILEERGQYLFPVKDNQPNLHKEAIQAFVIPEGFSPLCKAQST